MTSLKNVCINVCVYKGTYVGCTERMFKVRIDVNRSIGYRTGCHLNVKKQFAIRSHLNRCKYSISPDDFKILI